jgi:hypothetical protein
VEIRACSGADLKAVAYSSGQAGSNTKLTVRLTNISDMECSMPDGSPTVFGVNRDGSVVPFNAVGGGTYFGNPPPLNGPLQPGAAASVWVTGCVTEGSTQTQTWDAMLLGLPDGTTVEFKTDPHNTRCGALDVSTFGVADPPPG